MKESVRPARRADVQAIARVARSRATSAGWSAAQYEAAIDDSRYRFFVAETPQGVRGYAVLALAPQEAQVVDVAVDAAVEGRGVGRALLEALLDEAAALGCLKTTLEVSAVNSRAQRFYALSGFRVVGRRPKFYNDGSDAVLMDRDLP